MIDSVGFHDPQQSNSESWVKYLEKIQMPDGMNLQTDGFGCIILPIMVPKHKRIEEQTIQMLFEVLFLMNIANKRFLDSIIKNMNEGGTLPKVPTFVIVFNNLDKYATEIDSESSDESPINWFEDIKNTMREFLARKIEEYIY